MKYIKLFNQHSEYAEYEQSASFSTPNVSYCIVQDEVHSTAPSSTCQLSTVYELVGNPSYPSTIDADDTSFNLDFVIREIITTPKCEVIVTSEEESTTIVVGANDSNVPRTIESSYTYNGVVIPYTVIQNGK